MNNGLEDILMPGVRRVYTWEIYNDYREVNIFAYVVFNGPLDEKIQGGFYIND